MPSPTPLTVSLTEEAMDVREHIRKARSLAAGAHALFVEAEVELEMALAGQDRAQAICYQIDEARKDAIYRLNQGSSSTWRQRQTRSAGIGAVAAVV